MNKINFYVFMQLFKSCTLIFFIFLSIAWLLQTSRLFSIINIVQIKFIDIFTLSIFLLPSLINITFPFILIFGVVLCFIKLDKDKELIAIYSLGFGSNSIKYPLISFGLILTFFYIIFNFYLSPTIYEKYKQNEFELRNKIDFEKFILSNFIELNNKTILDFDRQNKNFENIFIKLDDKTDSIIYAKKGKILSNIDNHIFNLIDGFKIDIFEKEIEKLQFKSYSLSIPQNKNIEYNNFDNNTQTLIDDIKKNNIFNIIIKLSDIIIFILIIYFFYKNNIIKNNFKLYNNIKFIVVCVVVLIVNQLLKNTGMQYFQFIVFNLINLIIFFSLITFSKYK